MKVTRRDNEEGDQTFFVGETGTEQDHKFIKAFMLMVDQLIGPISKDLALKMREIVPPLSENMIILTDDQGRLATMVGTLEPEYAIKALKRAIEMMENVQLKKGN